MEARSSVIAMAPNGRTISSMRTVMVRFTDRSFQRNSDVRKAPFGAFPRRSDRVPERRGCTDERESPWRRRGWPFVTRVAASDSDSGRFRVGHGRCSAHRHRIEHLRRANRDARGRMQAPRSSISFARAALAGVPLARDEPASGSFQVAVGGSAVSFGLRPAGGGRLTRRRLEEACDGDFTPAVGAPLE